MAQEVPEGRGEGRARGVCGGEGTRCGAEMPRTELTEQGVRRHAASECVGRRRRAGAGGRSAVIGAPFALCRRNPRFDNWFVADFSVPCRLSFLWFTGGL